LNEVKGYLSELNIHLNFTQVRVVIVERVL